MLEALRGARRQRILYKDVESLKVATTNNHGPQRRDLSLSLPLGRSLPVNSTSVGTTLPCCDSSLLTPLGLFSLCVPLLGRSNSTSVGRTLPLVLLCRVEVWRLCGRLGRE